MRVLHIIPSIAAQTGGPAEALAGWCDGLVALGAEIAVGALQSAKDGPQVEFPKGVKLALAQRDIPHVQYGRALATRLREQDFNIVHSHGLWTYPNYLAAQIARACDVPHVISPCGMLAPEALSRSRLKKRLALAGFQRRALADAAALIANSRLEQESIARAVPNARVALVPNPIRPRPEGVAERFASAVENVITWQRDRRVLLFLGRLHPVKGVRRLLDVWRSLYQAHPEWHLVVAGPDQGGFAAAADQTGAADGRLIFLGQVSRSEKWALFERADLFVMPSDHENFGIAIAEALSAGVPTITTQATPWAALRESGAGWWIPVQTEALRVTLEAAMLEAPDARTKRAAAARDLASEFGVMRTGQRLINVYEQCLCA